MRCYLGDVRVIELLATEAETEVVHGKSKKIKPNVHGASPPQVRRDIRLTNEIVHTKFA